MFSRVGVGWLYNGFFGVDIPEGLDVDVALVTHHHERHIRGALKAARVVINPIEYSFATEFERVSRYIDVVFKRAGAPTSGKPKPTVYKFSGSVYKFTAGWIDLGEMSMRVVPCGSHTWGHTCFISENAVFTGDVDKWIVSVSSLLNVISMLRELRGGVVYTGDGERLAADEYAASLESNFRKLAKSYMECLSEKTPYRIALCARGGGDVLRLSEEGLAFVKYLAEVGHVKIVTSSPYTVRI